MNYPLLSTNKFNLYIDMWFKSKLTIIILLIISYIIVIPNLDRTSFWIDEMFSVYSVTSNSLNSMFNDYILKDVHPPLYQISLYYWSRFTGNSEYEIRVLSYIFILISFIISYYLLVKYFSRRVAIIFISLSLSTPAILYYAEEARAYALLYSLANILSIQFLIFREKIKDDKNLPYTLIFTYSLFSILICYTHFFGYILVFSISIYLIIYSYNLKRFKTTLQLFIVSALIGILAIIWLYVMIEYGNISNKLNGNFWIDNDYIGVVYNFLGLLFGNIVSLLFGAILFLSIIISNISKREIIAIFRNQIFLLLPISISIIVAVMISLKTPIITGRNLLIIIPLILLFMTFLFNTLYDRKKIVISLYIISLLSSTIYKNFTYIKEDWRGASLYIANNFNRECKVPTDFNRELMPILYSKFYLKDSVDYILGKAIIQEECDLIYFDGHISINRVKDILKRDNIVEGYEILDFNNVYIVVKR